MSASTNSTPSIMTPADVKPKRNISISTCMRLLVFLICAAVFIYQSTKSVIQYFDNPVTTTLSEREVTRTDYPYIIACHEDFFLKDKDEHIKKLAALIDSLDSSHNDTKSYPWRSVLLRDIKQDDFADIFFELYDNEKQAAYRKPDKAATGKVIFSAAQGVCKLFNPWSSEEKQRFLTIFGDDRIKQLLLKFVHNPEDVPKIMSTLKESWEYHSIDMPQRPHLQLEIKKTEHISTKQRPCSVEDGYLQTKCLDQCFANNALESLSVICGLPWLKPVLDAPSCDNFVDYNNLQTALSQSLQSTKISKLCDEKCPEACIQTKYKVVERNPKADFLNSTFGFISIDPTVKVVKEFAAYKFMNMFGDIGGIAGILLGYSVFGIYESVSQYLRDRKEGSQV